MNVTHGTSSTCKCSTAAYLCHWSAKIVPDGLLASASYATCCILVLCCICNEVLKHLLDYPGCSNVFDVSQHMALRLHAVSWSAS